MTDYFQLVLDFHRKFNQAPAVNAVFEPQLRDKLLLRASLIREEAKEFDDALQDGDLVLAIKEACDLLYVTFGFFYDLNLSPDAFFREVHASNLSKVDEAGLPVRNENGKIVKEGTRYWKANIPHLLPIAQLKDLRDLRRLFRQTDQKLRVTFGPRRFHIEGRPYLAVLRPGDRLTVVAHDEDLVVDVRYRDSEKLTESEEP